MTLNGYRPSGQSVCVGPGRAAHQVVNLHQTEGECDVKRIRQIANWPNAIVVVPEQMVK